ncbi:MAG: carboxypeptidase-like regulatory domain-containing protein [Bacteroidetes bacterium]|nr:carboxypeptidase-like regulatory domain-containing protein [Bacteroidota bacterium]
MKNKKSYKIIFFFILIINKFLSQNTITVSGIVIDVESKKPIPNVYISLKGFSKKIISDSLGNFEINSLENNGFIFEHINYESEAVFIDTIIKKRSYKKIIFELQRKANLLNEIIVSTKTEITNPLSNIIDYGFIENKIVLLNYKKLPYKSEVIVLNELLDTLAISKLNFEPQSLFKDCFKNINIFSKDSSYQIAYQNNHIYIYKPYFIQEYKKLIGNCITSTNNAIYFIKKFGEILISNTNFHPFLSKNSSLSYFYIDKHNKKKISLFDVEDKKHTRERKDDNDMQKKIGGVYSNPNVVFRETVLLDEVFAPLFLINDSIFVFDFINNEINIFRNNTIISQFEIDFHKTKTWKREIQLDEIQHKFYSKYIDDDKIIYKHIHYNNGLVEKSYIMPSLFCIDIKIMNGYAYYLMKNKNSFNLTLNRVFFQ